MRQITFEMLRHGPPHNQLLSPLTDYLALCENHAAVSINVPFEHNQFLHRLRALSYKMGHESRLFQLQDTARVLGNVLAHVPGLIAELNRDPGLGTDAEGARPQRLTHLRLVISSSELALLPFELALTPNGFPGAGQPLLLQSQEPICLTREVRRVPEDFTWHTAPRVLFASAAPASDVPPVPFEDHLRILERLLEPWVRYSKSDEERQKQVSDHLVVINNATAEAIQQACATHRFTHIHILAHGLEYLEGFDVRFGIALHDVNQPDRADRVSGERLATVLRPAQAGDGVGLARPMVVTLASCDSSNQGAVAGMGASIAHTLHAAGIPMVIASQFPLSVAGSLIALEVLYSSLLWAEDPRAALNDARRRLHSQLPFAHDWASLTAYVSLPKEFDRHLSEMQVSQVMRSIEVAMNYADKATAQLMTRTSTEPSGELGTADKGALLEDARGRIEKGKSRLERLLHRGTRKEAQIHLLLASTEKRCAEVYHSFSRLGPSREGSWLPLLASARRNYWEAFLCDSGASWAVVQYLSLDLVLRRLLTPLPEVQAEKHEDHNRPDVLWKLSHVLSSNELRSSDKLTALWALGNDTELYLLALLMDKVPAEWPRETFVERAVQRARDLVDRGGRDSFEVYSTRRQLLRYVEWYNEVARLSPDFLPAVERVLGVLPESKKHALE